MPACRACGELNPERARFCLACGTALVGGPPAQPGQERRLVSVLFLDIVGSTALADGADPEDVRDRLRAFHEPVRRQVELHGGAIEKFIGDAVVAVFGVPVAHGDDSARAVRCGLRILEEVAALNHADARLNLAVRGGVATGEAVIELGDGASRGEPLATGDVMNTAARLQAAAAAGTVVVSAETYRATRRDISYRALAPVLARGKAAALEAWVATSSGFTAMQQEPAPLYGREQALGTLMELFEAAVAAGRPAAAALTGEPGIGKSRLAAEVAARLGASDVALYRGRCRAYSERLGFQATAEQLKQAAGIFEIDPPERARAKLENLVGGVLPAEEVARVTRALSLLLGLGLDEPIEARAPILLAMRRLVEGLCRSRPTLFVFEDLQWADESQLELITSLLERVTGVPALFLLLARAGEGSAFSPPAEATVVSLEPLDGEAAAAMVAGLTAGGTLQDADIRGLLATAGGNPLFLEELAAAAREGAASALPATVREALAARIDALAPGLRRVLVDASVVGETFWRGTLAAMDGADDGALAGHLSALAQAGFITPLAGSRLEGDVEYSFKHVLVRDAAYGTLTRPVRRQRHAQVAEFLEAAVGGGPQNLDTTLAHHWREAGRPDRAVPYLLGAADRATDVWAAGEAGALFAAAIELTEDPQVRVAFRLRRALAMVRLTDFDAGAAEIDEILPSLKGADEVNAVLARAWCAYWTEDSDDAVRFAKLGLQLAEAHRDPEMLGPALVNQAFAAELAGDVARAPELFAEAHRAWVPGTRSAEYAALHEGWADALYWAGEYEEAGKLARLALSLGRGAHSIQPVLRGGSWLGLTMGAQGQTEEAIAWLDEMFRQAQDLDPKWGAAILNYTSLPYRDMRMFDVARDFNERALDLITGRGAWGMPEMEGAIDLMFADIANGDFGSALEAYPGLWDAALNGKAWRPWLGGSRVALARAELARHVDQPDTAAELARDALDRAVRIRRPKYEALARGLLGSALLRSHQREEALAEFRAAVNIADGLGAPTGRWELRAELGRALVATGDETGATEVYAQAGGIIRDYAATLTADHRAHFLASADVAVVLRAAGSG